MKIKSNIIKGWVTSILGVLFMLASLALWFLGVINMVWEGVAGIILGTILLYAPRTIEKKLSEAIGAWGNKGAGGYGGDIDIDIGRRSPHVPPTPQTDDEPSIKDEPK